MLSLSEVFGISIPFVIIYLFVFISIHRAEPLVWVIAGSLARGRLEVLIAQPAAAALEQLHDLPVACHVAQELARLGVIHGRAARHLDGAVLAILARALVLIARLAVGGNDVAGVLQVNERPQVGVALQVHVAATAAVAAVGTALGHIFGAVEVPAAGAALARAAQYLYIINKIRICHLSVFYS